MVQKPIHASSVPASHNIVLSSVRFNMNKNNVDRGFIVHLSVLKKASCIISMFIDHENSSNTVEINLEHRFKRMSRSFSKKGTVLRINRMTLIDVVIFCQMPWKCAKCYGKVLFLLLCQIPHRCISDILSIFSFVRCCGCNDFLNQKLILLSEPQPYKSTNLLLHNCTTLKLYSSTTPH